MLCERITLPPSERSECHPPDDTAGFLEEEEGRDEAFRREKSRYGQAVRKARRLRENFADAAGEELLKRRIDARRVFLSARGAAMEALHLGAKSLLAAGGLKEEIELELEWMDAEARKAKDGIRENVRRGEPPTTGDLDLRFADMAREVNVRIGARDVLAACMKACDKKRDELVERLEKDQEELAEM